MSHTFAVADVVPSNTALETTDLNTVVKARVKNKLNAHSPSDARLVTSRRSAHALVQAAHRAFADHRPLILTPDAIWTTIAQGFARHVGLNHEQYRSCFVKHEGKKRLEVWTASFPGTDSLPWDTCVKLFADKVKDEIGAQTCDLITSDFTTTGPVERAVSQVVLLDAMQSYFEYFGGTMCGIPSITLEGTPEDWEKVHAKVEGLKAYGGLDWWLDYVLPITKQFVNASKGQVDKPFWNSLFKEQGASGGPYINGWIMQLLPYLYNNERGEAAKVDRRNPLLTREDQSDSWGGGGQTWSKIPGSLSTVPFIWNYNGPEFDHEFVAGLFGFEQTASGALKPVFGWAVTTVKQRN